MPPANRSIHFSKRLHDFKYLYYRDRVQTMLEGIEIPPQKMYTTFLPDSQERQTDCERDWLGGP